MNTNTTIKALEAYEPTDTVTKFLKKACSMKRAHGSTTEAEFAAFLCRELNPTMIDGAGNLHFDRRRNGEKTLFTAHSDTVHRTGGDNKFSMSVENGQEIWRAQDAALGADDGAGVALIAHMLLEGVSGYFLICRGEEQGGVGSSWLADNMSELLKQFDRAIAFDRADGFEVITYQAGGVCASDEFAEALSTSLNNAGMLYMPSSAGIYTDTAEFTGLIPECTNLGVFYSQQHSDREWQNVTQLRLLGDALVKIDWETLPTSRGVHESHYTGYPFYVPHRENEVEFEHLCLEAAHTGRTGEVWKFLLGLIVNLPDYQPSQAIRSNITLADVDSYLDTLYSGFTLEDIAREAYEDFVN